MPFSPGTRFGPYEIAALIGVGGMGEVYRAGDAALKRDVAIKVLPEFLAGDAERLARFQREAEMLAALNHQNIAHVYGLERSGTTTGLVMELVDGPTLADRIAQGRIALAEALPIAMQIADALEAAHERGIVHRDLKPANIKLRADSTVKVLDFGNAKALQPAFAASGSQTRVANTPSVTQIGTILGTAAYMSPEQARGKPVDKRTDVWAFGCVLYEMLTGKPAFDGEDATTTIGRVLEREVDMRALPVDVPAGVRKTLTACLQKDAKKRVRDIGDVKLALDGAFETRVQPAGAQPAWRRALALAAAFALGAAALGLVAWRLWPAPEPRTVTRLSMPTTVSGPAMTAISPDGRRVGYRDSNSQTIQVRDLDQFEARAIPVSSDSNDAPPCFSPDGQWIAYSNGNTGQLLKKAPISGGAALTVAQNLVGAASCHWGEDGYIYFGTTPGIMRAPEAGGPAERVVAPSAERGEALVYRPQLLPGGAQLLYSVVGERGVESVRVDVLNLVTQERKTVLDGVGVATFVPATRRASRGYLVYGLNGALFAAPFDARSLEAGAARPVVSDILGSGPASSASVSASGTLAYLSGPNLTDFQEDATLIAVDRDGTQQALPGPPDIYGEVAFSPDGRRAAIARVDVSGNTADVWIYELDGDRFNRITFEGANFGVIWTPDGKRLIYLHADSVAAVGGTRMELRSVPTDGSGAASTLVGSANWMRGGFYATSVSPDGKALLLAAEGATDVLALTLDEGSPPAVSTAAPRPFVATAYRESWATFSPNGRFVAYTSNESGRDEVYVVPYPGPGGKSQVSLGGGTMPRWNRNGKELFYLSAGKLMNVEVDTSATFRVLTPRALFDTPPLVQNRGLSYDVSPDGTRFLMLKSGASAEQQTELRVVINWIDELERVAPAARR
jgi:serine/threonine-protein kinase